MTPETTMPSHAVAVIGAGPAGMYAARMLAAAGHHVVIFNRDLKYGGLAEYGIFMTKHTMKEGIRKAFRKILGDPKVVYYGGVKVGTLSDLTLDQVRGAGFSAVVVAAGAQGTKELGLPGEHQASGLYHAKDLVYHFNRLPPFATRPFPIGRRAAIIGMGNVMVDVGNFLLNHVKTPEVTVIARRGPAERKYDRKEFEAIAQYLDLEGLRAEIERVKPMLAAVGQDPETLYREIAADTPGPPQAGQPRLFFRFLTSPMRVRTDPDGNLKALVVEENLLAPKGGKIACTGTGRTTELPLDTVVFAIGDRVDEHLGLPYKGGEFVTTPPPEGSEASYEVLDPTTGKAAPGSFVVGWSRKASDGLVGKARKDAEAGTERVLRWLALLPAPAPGAVEAVKARAAALVQGHAPYAVTTSDIWALEEAEREEARRRGLEWFKYSRNSEMLEVIARAREARKAQPAAVSR